MEPREQTEYKFENLQPLTYLKRFNKMVEEDLKHPLSLNKKDLKIMHLSKFPLPVFYAKMQGIFDTGAKKSNLAQLSAKSKEDQQDEQFYRKHNEFMVRTIEGIVRENQSHKASLEDYKNQYRTRGSSISEAELKRSTLRGRSNKPKPSTRPKIEKDSRVDDRAVPKKEPKRTTSPKVDGETKLTYLERVQSERLLRMREVKKPSIRFRQNAEIEAGIKNYQAFLTVRENQKSIDDPVATTRPKSLNGVEEDDESGVRKAYVSQLLRLQRKQCEYQERYSAQIENNIQKFDQKIRASLKQVASSKFW